MPYSPIDPNATCIACERTAIQHGAFDAACPSRHSASRWSKTSRFVGSYDDLCGSCGSRWGEHSDIDCPDGLGGWTLRRGWQPPQATRNGPDGPGPIEGEGVPEPETGKPVTWPDTELHHALAEGLYRLAGDLYRLSARKQILVSVTLDRAFMAEHGLGTGCEIMTATGPVKVVAQPVPLEQVFGAWQVLPTAQARPRSVRVTPLEDDDF